MEQGGMWRAAVVSVVFVFGLGLGHDPGRYVGRGHGSGHVVVAVVVYMALIASLATVTVAEPVDVGGARFRDDG